MSYSGELAALGAAACWSVSSLSFSLAGRRIGSLPVNVIRMILGLVFVSAIAWALRGLPWPTEADGRTWLLLSLSGLLGFSLGDLCLFKALVLIGARLTMLVMCLWPIFAALLSWLAFDEALTPLKLLGMAVTLGGVGWVVLEQRANPKGEGGAGTDDSRPRTAWHGWGVTLAVCGALGQAGGYVLAKPVMADLDAFAATQIRSLAGLAGFVVLGTALGIWRRVWAARKDRRALAHTANGAFFGPCLGVALSLLALRYIAPGVAATLAATAPVMMIPLVIIVLRERVTWRSVVGACVAVGGVAVLFL